MMKFNVDLDERSVKQMRYITGFQPHWDEHMHNDLERDLAEAAEAYFKPMLRTKRGYGTGDTERSIRHEFTSTGDGVEIVYYGLLSALYMDDGNFPADQEMWTPRGNAQRAFPIDKRFLGANAIYSPVIHGMGHRTPGVPTHYSDKTAEYMADGKATEIALQSIEKWFDSVVIGA